MKTTESKQYGGPMGGGGDAEFVAISAEWTTKHS